MSASTAGGASRVAPVRGVPLPTRTQVASRLPLALAVALSLMGLGMRVFQIQQESVWYDEGYTLLFSRMPLDRLISVGGAHEHPPFFYLLVHLALQIQDSYLAPRLVAAVCGAGSIVVIYLLGERLFSPAVGLIAAGLLTIAPVHLWNSQNGRAYELTALLVLLSYLCLYASLDRPQYRRWVAYGVATALALYTDYTAALVLAPQALLLIRARERGVVRALVVSWAAVAVAYLPWVGVLLIDVAHVAQSYWIPAPDPDLVSDTVFELMGFMTICPTGTSCQPDTFPPLALLHLGIVPTLLAGASALALCVYAVRQRRLTILVLSLWMVLPFILLLAVSIVRPLFLDRYVLETTFPLYVLVGAAVVGSWRVRRSLALAVGALVVLAGSSVYDTGVMYATESHPDWKTPMRDLGAAYRPGQVVAYYPGVVKAMTRPYLPPNWSPSYEEAIWLHTYLDVPSWGSKYLNLNDYQLRDRELSRLTAGRRQVWIVDQQYAGVWDVWRWLTAHHFYFVLDERYRGQTHIQLWDRKPPSQFGRPIVPNSGFRTGWLRRGRITISSGVARTSGPSTLTRVFPITSGSAYVVSASHQSFSLPEPTTTVRAYSTCSAARSAMTADTVQPLASFPQLDHFDLWVNHTWIDKPFGFVAPPGASCGLLTLQTYRGVTNWRHIAVYRQR